MNIRLNLILLFGISLSMSCVSVSYITDTSPESSLEKYITYSVEEHCLDFQIGVNPINQQRIENAIYVNLRNEGLRPMDNGDLLIKYFVTNQTRHVLEGCEDYYDEWEGGRYCVERLHSYTEGTLVIDIIDSKQEKVVWHGAAVGPAYDKIKNPDSKIRKIVNQLLEDFNDKRKA